MAIEPDVLRGIAETLGRAQRYLDDAQKTQSPATAVMRTMASLDLTLDALRDLTLALGHKP